MEKEIWLPIKYGNGKKEVSNLGRVRNSKTKRILKQYINNTGYPSISFWVDGANRSFKVHRLVAEAFIPNPEKLYTVNHKDFVKKNNCVSNLEWCGIVDNVKHYFKNGFKGIISDDDVLFIRKNIEELGCSKIASIIGISRNYVFCVANGTYKPDVHTEFIREKRTSLPQVVRKYNKEGNLLSIYKSISEAARENGVKISHIQRVLSGERSSLHNYIYACDGYKQVTGKDKCVKIEKLRELSKAKKTTD